MRVLALFVAFWGLTIGSSCSRVFPQPHSGELKVLVLSYDSAAGRYRLVVGSLSTLSHVRTMEGDAANIIGGAEIVIDYDEIARANPQTQEELDALTRKDEGGPVDFAAFEVDGVLHPEDFHSLNIATTYYNFEKSHLFFAGLGAALYGLPVLYFPVLKEGGGGSALETLKDNAFWDPVGRFFAVLPFEEHQELPMGMNLGIIAHEFTHAVFSSRVFPKEGMPWLYAEYYAAPERWSRAMNLNRSVNEGLADFFGGVVSNDPRFVARSLSVIENDRTLVPAAPRCMTRELEQAVEALSHSNYNPYPLGSVLAAALWEVAGPAPERRQAFSRGLLDSLTDIGLLFQSEGELIRLPSLLDAMAATFVADLKPKACGVFLERFGLSPEELPSCGEFETPTRRCP